jgi:hypothetical protein
MIYLIITEDEKFAKIGYTFKDISIRKSGLQTSNPVKLILKDQFNGSRYVEKYLHIKCAEFNTLGEWFNYSEDFKNVYNTEKNVEESIAERIVKSYKKETGKPKRYITNVSCKRVSIPLDEKIINTIKEYANKFNVPHTKFLNICITTLINSSEEELKKLIISQLPNKNTPHPKFEEKKKIANRLRFFKIDKDIEGVFFKGIPNKGKQCIYIDDNLVVHKVFLDVSEENI